MEVINGEWIWTTEKMLSNGAPNGRLDLESAISPLVPLTMSLWSFKTCITTVWDLVSQCEGEAHSRRNYGLEFCIVLLSWQIWTNSFFFKDWVILFIHPSLPLSSLRPFPDNLKLPIYFLRTSQHGFPLPQPRSSMKLTLLPCLLLLLSPCLQVPFFPAFPSLSPFSE